jgi:hypothetical protein
MSLETKELIKEELKKLVTEAQQVLQGIKRVAIAEAWKILQLAIASVIRIIEKIGTDLSGPEKKQLAMDAISNFYDKAFIVIDIPMIPTIAESFIHKFTKQFLMLLVSSTIDAMVATFRDIGVFEKPAMQTQSVVIDNFVTYQFLTHLKSITRTI